MLFIEGVLFLDRSFRLNFSALKPAAPAPPSCGGIGCQERDFSFPRISIWCVGFFFFGTRSRISGVAAGQTAEMVLLFIFFFN